MYLRLASNLLCNSSKHKVYFKSILLIKNNPFVQIIELVLTSILSLEEDCFCSDRELCFVATILFTIVISQFYNIVIAVLDFQCILTKFIPRCHDFPPIAQILMDTNQVCNIAFQSLTFVTQKCLIFGVF